MNRKCWRKVFGLVLFFFQSTFRIQEKGFRLLSLSFDVVTLPESCLCTLEELLVQGSGSPQGFYHKMSHWD